MLRSLRLRLLVPTIVVALLAVVATTIVTNVSVTDDVRSDLRDEINSEREIIEVLDTYAFFNETWLSADRVIADLAFQFAARVTLTDLAGELILDSSALGVGPEIEHSGQELAVIDASNIDQSIIDSASLDLFEVSEEAIITCLDSLGASYEVVIDDSTGLPSVFPDGTSESFEAFDFCLSGQFSQPDNAEIVVNGIGIPKSDTAFDFADPALLFVSFESPLTDIGGGFDGRLLVAVLGVLLVATAIMAVVASRILHPIRGLTTATRQMSAGKLSSRVESVGADELGALGTAFNAMAESLEEEDRRRRRLTSDVAHELRSPLSNIRGYLEAARDGVTPLDQALVDIVLGDALLLQQLIDDLQVVSLADSGELRLRTDRMPLRPSIDAVIESHGAVARERGVVLIVDAPEEHFAMIDETRFRQILQNLVANAVRYTDEGGEVHIDTKLASDWITVIVADTGSGIAAAHVLHVFDRFYRVDESRTRGTGGTGLGLAITKSLVEAHGGTVSVDSVEGNGSTFTFTLPSAARG